MPYDLPAFPNNGGQGGARLAQVMENFAQQQTQLGNAAKAADYYRKSLGTDDAGGVTDEEWQNMGSADKVAWHQGVQDSAAQQRMAAQADAQRQETLARVATYGAQAADRTADANAGAQAGQFLKRYGELTSGQPAAPNINADDEEIPSTTDTGGSAPLPPTQAFSQTMSEMPDNFDVTRALPKVMDSLAKWQQVTGGGSDNGTPTSMTMPDGGVVYYQKGSKNPLVVSPVTKGNVRSDEIDEQADANASKGLMPPGTTFSTTDNGFGIASLPDGSIKNLGRVPTGAKKSSFFAQFMGSAAPAAAAPAASAAPSLPAVTTKADFNNLASGAQYIGKDGKTYQKP